MYTGRVMKLARTLPSVIGWHGACVLHVIDYCGFLFALNARTYMTRIPPTYTVVALKSLACGCYNAWAMHFLNRTD